MPIAYKDRVLAELFFQRKVAPTFVGFAFALAGRQDTPFGAVTCLGVNVMLHATRNKLEVSVMRSLPGLPFVQQGVQSHRGPCIGKVQPSSRVAKGVRLQAWRLDSATSRSGGSGR